MSMCVTPPYVVVAGVIRKPVGEKPSTNAFWSISVDNLS